MTQRTRFEIGAKNDFAVRRTTRRGLADPGETPSGIHDLIAFGEPLVGTANDDFMFGFTQPNNTFFGGEGDDFVLGDIGPSFWTIYAHRQNLDLASAVNLEAFPDTWTKGDNPLLGDSTIPHALVYVEGTAAQHEFFSVAIGAGETITIDIDIAYGAPIGVGTTDTMVQLLDAGGNVLITVDDGGNGPDDGLGSLSLFDTFLSFTVATAGIYYIKVGEYAVVKPFEGDETFLMNVSITGHGFVAASPQGNDTINGEGGNDYLLGGRGSDSIEGGIGNDTASGDRNDDTVRGGDGFDQLLGGVGEDLLDGGADGDTLRGGVGGDVLQGGDGSDTIDYFDSPTGVMINLTTLAASGGDAAGDSWTSIESVFGSNLSDTITGDAGDNTISGNGGDDLLTGGETGNLDLLVGGEGDDTLVSNGEGSFNGGNGDDLIVAGVTDLGATEALYGAGGDDTLDISAIGGLYTIDLAANTTTIPDKIINSFKNLITGNGAQTIIGSTVANIIAAGAGNDTVNAGDAADTLDGGAGNDSLFGEAGDDLFRFIVAAADPAQTDAIDGGTELDTLDLAGSGVGALINYGASGVATLANATIVFAAIERVVGTGLADVFTSQSQFFAFEGGGGRDTLDMSPVFATGAQFWDLTLGYLGNLSFADPVQGTLASFENFIGFESADDRVRGGDPGNVLDGRGGDDSLEGQGGRDTLIGGVGADTLDGGGGEDWASYATAGGPVAAFLNNPAANSGDALGDSYISIENVLGSDFGDTLRGTGTANVLDGGDGADSLGGFGGGDTLRGGAGGDTLDGGSGLDWADYSSALRVIADLQIPANNNRDALGDSYVSIENLRGGDLADNLRGDGNANRIEGGVRNDVIVGRAGDDILVGGPGFDQLAGQQGVDSFLLASPDEADYDRIVDLALNETILLDGVAFGLAPGALDPDAFVLGTGAQDAEDRIIYLESVGKLFFDPDGVGGVSRELIAIIENRPAMDASDFLVI